MLRNKQLSGGLIMFFFQFLAQAGLFFVVPLYLSVCLGLSALATGARLLPLSLTLLLAAIGIPKLLPERLAAARRPAAACSRSSPGRSCCSAALDADAGPEIVFVPMLLVGLGIGALASQLGAVTVSAVPDEESPEVGGIQNTMTNLGASLGTALAGSILIAAVALVLLVEHPAEPGDPGPRRSRRPRSSSPAASRSSRTPIWRRRSTRPASSSRQTDAAITAYQDARLDGLRSALAVLGASDRPCALRGAAHPDDASPAPPPPSA